MEKYKKLQRNVESCRKMLKVEEKGRKLQKNVESYGEM